jgi:hypothetical protein
LAITAFVIAFCVLRFAFRILWFIFYRLSAQERRCMGYGHGHAHGIAAHAVCPQPSVPPNRTHHEMQHRPSSSSSSRGDPRRPLLAMHMHGLAPAVVGRNLVRLRDFVGAPRGRTGLFFASMAVVGTWGDQPPSGVVGGAALAFANFAPPWPGRGGRFFSGGCFGGEWLDRTGAACRSWARQN